jgi:hypothetical protein
MIAIFHDKYIIYAFDDNMSLQPQGINYYTLIDGIIYENFVFVFLTANGFFYHILSELNSFPNKLFRASEDIINNHMKITKKTKEKLAYYYKKPFPQKILSVVRNNLIVSDGFNQVTIYKLENILFRIIHSIIERKVEEVINALPILDKKYIKSLLAILDHYYGNDEAAYRRIFSQDMIEHFELYKYLDFPLEDFIKFDKVKTEKYLKRILIKELQNKDEIKIKKLYEFCSKYEL